MENKNETTHDEAFASLPWFVNQTLHEDEASAIESHVAECGECRAEIDALAEMRQVVAGEIVPMVNSDERFARVMDRIDDYEAARSSMATTRPDGQSLLAGLIGSWMAWSRPVRFAYAVQFIVLAALIVGFAVMTQRARDAQSEIARERERANQTERLLHDAKRRYEVLTGESPVDSSRGLRVTVAFQERATARDIRVVLSDINAEIVSGPSAQNFYVLRLTKAIGDDAKRIAADALRKLNARTDVVLLAEMRHE